MEGSRLNEQIDAFDSARTIAIRWPKRTTVEAILAREVHLWATLLDLSNDRLARLQTNLSGDEFARAGRFHHAVDRARFIAARGQLREVLSDYAGVNAREIAFEYTRNGKPMMAPGATRVPLQFSVSHSGGLAIFAISLIGRLGVDVEAVKPLRDAAEIASEFFSPAECQELSSMPPSCYIDAFYRCWTRKESYLKAIGTGLLLPLNAFDVAIASTGSNSLLRVGGDESASRRWSIVHLSPAESFVGALAVESRRVNVRCWRLSF